MPELPEVETIVRDLDGLVRGRTIREVTVPRPDLIEGEEPARFTEGLQGRRIKRVTRRAKNIVFRLDGDERLVVNLGMTGRMLVGAPGEPSPAHLGVRFLLDNGREMFYHDVRRFGRLWRMSGQAWTEWEAGLGVEPLAPEFTPELLFDLTRRSRVAIKSWLMDQRRIVGIGNIYASEGLFRAGTDPRRPAHTLSRGEAARLHDAIRQVLSEAIDYRGTTLLDYRDARGERGGFRDWLRVYGRAGLPCPTCNREIQRIVQGGRSTFFCDNCQG